MADGSLPRDLSRVGRVLSAYAAAAVVDRVNRLGRYGRTKLRGVRRNNGREAVTVERTVSDDEQVVTFFVVTRNLASAEPCTESSATSRNQLVFPLVASATAVAEGLTSAT